jgi:opacity protein-like surface antigen
MVLVWMISDSPARRNSPAAKRPKRGSPRNRGRYSRHLPVRDDVSDMKSSRQTLAGLALLLLGTVGAGVTHAQSGGMHRDDEIATNWSWEVTPFVGYRMGGDFDLDGSPAASKVDLDDHGSFGLAVNLFSSGDKSESYELFYSRQKASVAKNSPLAPFDLNVEYLHLGGTLNFNDELPVRPYIAGGLGLTRFSPQTGNGGDDSRFSLSLGAGVKLPVTKRFNVRLEARGFLTLVNSQSAFFCASGTQGGVCAIRVKGDSFIQYELLAGAAFAF